MKINAVVPEEMNIGYTPYDRPNLANQNSWMF